LGSTLIQAKVKSADFAVAKKQTEDLLNKNITFNYQGKSYQPNKKEIGAWIVFANNSGQFSASIDDTNAKAYMNKIARNFEAKKIDRKITDSGEVLQAGREGVYLDKDATLNSLKSLLAQSQIAIELPVVKEAPKEIKVNITNGVETGRYEGKYIDINLSTQRFCRVDGVNLIDCLITSTGKPSMPTPTGDFKVLNKIPMAWSSIYHLYMPWWQQINGPIGIHELVMWPDGTKEDVSHLGQTVSHGCIRLGPGTAEMIFNWTEIGTPVYVHK
jgi:lipoprotein-anchoring transpeptidase ErfK/SrfK